MRRYRFVLLPLASFLMMILITILFVLPKIKTIFDVKGRLGKEKEKLSTLTKKATFLEGLDQYELESRVATAEKALPSKGAVVEIIATLSSLSSESGVSFVGFEMSPGELLPTKYEELSFQATFQGSRDKVEDFLARTRKALPILKIVGFEIQEEKTTITFETYLSPLPKSLGKIDTPLSPITTQEEKIYQLIAQFEGFKSVVPSVSGGKEDLFSGL